MKMARIDGRDVPVAEGQSVVYFASGEQGSQEAGDYCFWTIYGEDEFGDWHTIARALACLPPEDRFLRMDAERSMDKDGESRISYRMAWKRMPTAKGIRPAFLREIVRWFLSHEGDVKFAEPFAVMNGERKTIPRSLV